MTLKNYIAEPNPIYIPVKSNATAVKAISPSITSLLSSLDPRASDIALFAIIKSKADNSIVINTKFIKSYQEVSKILQGASQEPIFNSKPIGYQAVTKHIISLINSFILIKLHPEKKVYLINPGLSHQKLPAGLCTYAQDFSERYDSLRSSGQLTFEKAQEIANEYYGMANALFDKAYRNDDRREYTRLAVAKHRANKKKNKPKKEG